jgi:hypothetical protein
MQMQATNLELVDHFLIQSERDLLREYIEIEQTPLPTALFVSALSQLWLFGVYELLRTWRQRAKDVLRWAKEFYSASPKQRPTILETKKLEIERRAADPNGVVFYWPAYERVAMDEAVATRLKNALDRGERLFRRIEAFRITLAKHELPGTKNSFASGAGFGRIDMTDGSIYWQVVLRGNEVDLVSRRTIADECRRLGNDDYSMILPEAIQTKVKRFPNSSYGIKKATLILRDGQQYPGVHIAWSREIVHIEGHEIIPFDIADTVDARHEADDQK